MNKNLVAKSILTVVLVAAALWTLLPPKETLKQGIDLAGGTSLIYAIDTEGLSAAEEKDLAQRMIQTLRRRIDPANIQNLIWRPQGNTRFEIQMPLASKATQQMRQAYETALNDLLARNINPATIMRSLQEPAAERTETLARYAQGDPNRTEILQTLVSAYDARRQAQERRDTLYQKLDDLKKTLSDAGVAVDRVEANRGDWIRLAAAELASTLKDFAGSEEQVAPLTEYVTAYKELVDVLNQLTAESGLNDQYDAARRKLDQLNLTIDQVTYILEMDQRSSDRVKRNEQLKAMFPRSCRRSRQPRDRL
jgi:SecD/SecF fusion protein